MTDTVSPARLRQLRAIIAGAWVFATIAIVGSLLLWSMRGFPALPLSFMHGPGANFSVALLGFTYGTVGAMLASRRPTNFIGWLFLTTGVLLGLVIPLNLLVAESVHTFRAIPSTTLLLAWGISSFDAPLAAGTAFIVAVIFPGNRPPGLWRRLVVVQLFAFVLVGVASALNPGGLIWFPTLPNPLRLPESLDPAISALQIVALVLVVASMIGSAVSLPIRYRSADPHLRLQLRWILAAIALLPFTTSPLFIARYGLGASNDMGEMLMVIAGVGGCAFPVAVAIAIMRHHLFGIDRLVERALVFVPLMAILAGLYAASVALFQRLFMAVTGSTSEASVILSTLILASTFTPIRQALERVVDRRFNPKHAATANLVQARVVGEPSMVPAASMMVDLPSMRAQASAGARDGGYAGRSREEASGGAERAAASSTSSAAAPSLPVAEPSRSLFEPTPPADARVVEALDRLADRLHAIESRIAHLEERQVEDEMFGFSGAVVEGGDPASASTAAIPTAAAAPAVPGAASVPSAAASAAVDSGAALASGPASDRPSSRPSDPPNPLPAVDAVPQPARLGS